MDTFADWPTLAEETDLFARLRAGDRTVWEEIASRYLPLLTQFLARIRPRAPAESRNDAADTALINFVTDPATFDPDRGTLGAFLRLAATCDLQNLLDREGRARREIPLDFVAEPVDRRNHFRDNESGWDDPRLTRELAALDQSEQTAFRLMRAGERRTAAFAGALGLTHLSEPEQAAEVKRVKDRVTRRLVRAVRGTP